MPRIAADPFHGDSRRSLRERAKLLHIAHVEELCIEYATSAEIRAKPR